jgi:hypothetical protein
MTKSSSTRLSAARRNAESALGQRRQSPLDVMKQEQQAAHDAMAEKTARLKALRLAKEAADREAAPSPSSSSTPAKKVRRSKQT